MTRKEKVGVKKYNRVHYWIKYHYGKASRCTNPECTKKSTNYQWALIKGKKYEKDINNFIEMCVSCHMKYDVTDSFREKMRFIGKNRKITDKHRANIKKSKMGHKVSKETREKISKERLQRKRKHGYLNSPETRKKISMTLKKKYRKLREESKATN